MGDEKRLKYYFYATISFVVITIIILAVKLDIHPDEAYYFSWSRYLRSGYLDHPPAIAFLIKLSSIIFGGNFTIRGINIILSLISLIFIGYSVRIISKDMSSLYTALIIALLSPLFITGSVITTPDTPLVLFVSLYIFLSLRSFGDNTSYLSSIGAGVALGLALLSKYTAFIIWISLMFLFFRYKDKRKLKLRIVVIPIFISFVTYLPNLIYNIGNNYKSYLFQISHATANPSFEPLKTFLPFLLAQIMIFSPFLFIYFCLRINFFRKSLDDKEIFLSYTAAVPFMTFILLSLFKHTEANWAAYAFIPLLILTVPKLTMFYLPILSYQAGVFILLILQIFFSVIPLNPATDPMTQIKYWKKTSQLVADNIPKGRTIVTFRYQLASVLYYYNNITSLCLDRRFVNSEIGIMGAKDWAMIDFFPAKTATDIALNLCPDATVRIPLVISENMNIIRRIDIIYCKEADKGP